MEEIEKKIEGIQRKIQIHHDTIKKLRACASDVRLQSVGEQLESISQAQEVLLCELYRQLVELRQNKNA